MDRLADVSVGFERPSFREYMTSGRVRETVDWDVDWGYLSDVLRSIQEEGEDARIVQRKNGKFAIRDGKPGLKIDTKKARAAIGDAIERMEFAADISALVTDGTKKKEDLEGDFREVSWVNTWEISYDDGAKIDASTLAPCWDGLTLDLSRLDLSPILDSVCASHGGAGKVERFKAADGREMDVVYVTLGESVDRAAEEAEIRRMIAEKESQSGRKPLMAGRSGIGSDYVEVDIGAQKVYHVAGGAVHCQSDCVTGTAGRKDTPRGAFYISEKLPGTKLKPKGSTTAVWVDRWMRVTWDGVGLHDAPWRGAFGGGIYLSNGSHGCINLPPAYAFSLYDEVPAGTPVVIHD